MDQNLAKAALIFLGRAELKGAEADVFMQVVNALQALIAGEPVTNVKEPG